MNSTPTTPVSVALLRAAGLTKRYGEVLALDELHLGINAGDIFCLLGANVQVEKDGKKVTYYLTEAAAYYFTVYEIYLGNPHNWLQFQQPPLRWNSADDFAWACCSSTCRSPCACSHRSPRFTALPRRALNPSSREFNHIYFVADRPISRVAVSSLGNPFTPQEMPIGTVERRAFGPVQPTCDRFPLLGGRMHAACND